VVPDFRTRPVVLLEVEADPSRLRIGNLRDRQRGLLLTYGSDSAALVFNLGAPGEVRRQARPLGAHDRGERVLAGLRDLLTWVSDSGRVRRSRD